MKPSTRETFANPALESMSVGTPGDRARDREPARPDRPRREGGAV